MQTPTFRQRPKVGRNDKCPCGSGRKFKQCHGRSQFELPNLLSQAKLEQRIVEEGKRIIERYKIKELQRQRQQGLGIPIVSTEYKGYRFIAVANKIHYGKWKSFPDFLGNYLKATLGAAWGNAEIAKPIPERHPVMQWYDKYCHLQRQHIKGPGTPYSTPVTGAVSAYYRLAYNLYLIAHNGKDIQIRLINRLKNKDNFQGAYYETQVAAWLIKAGFELEFEDERDGSTSHCEFTATHVKSGSKYSVEAKSRETKEGGAGRIKVGSQLRKALAKSAKHTRLVFLDLNKALHTPAQLDRVIGRAEYIITSSEDIDIDGSPAPPAYVCISNMNDQHSLDEAALATAVCFVGYKIRGFLGEFPSILHAVRARERHLPMFELMRSMEDHRDIPQTFDGNFPSEAFVENPLPRIQIGRFFLVPGPDNVEVEAQVQHVAVMNDKAYCSLYDPKTNRTWIGTFILTPDELADHEKFGSLYFGAPQDDRRPIKTSVDLFDFLFASYSKTPKDKLLELMVAYPDRSSLITKTQLELAEIYSEQMAYATIAQGFKLDPPRHRYFKKSADLK